MRACPAYRRVIRPACLDLIYLAVTFKPCPCCARVCCGYQASSPPARCPPSSPHRLYLQAMLFGSTSLLVADHAGSGKTLAYLAPLIQVLHNLAHHCLLQISPVTTSHTLIEQRDTLPRAAIHHCRCRGTIRLYQVHHSSRLRRQHLIACLSTQGQHLPSKRRLGGSMPHASLHPVASTAPLDAA